MRLTISALTLSAMVLGTSAVAYADEGPSSVLTQAVMDGEASAPIPDDDARFASAVAMIKKRTGDAGPVMIITRRVAKFEKQPQCGRVAFIIGQPSAHVLYSDMSGELNICEDGEPPMQMCKGHPDKLVPPDSVCPDLSRPVNTPEVAAAIEAAVAAGSMTPQQLAKAVRDAQARAASSTQGSKQ
jgi:hypothetical protein